jgi:uncharacterized membrane protein
VYLTEDQWEEPTPNTLAEDIRAKRENPAASVADWTKDRAALKTGTIGFAMFMFVLLAASFFFVSGPLITAVVVRLTLAFLLVVMLVLGYRRKAREFDDSAPRQ